MLTLRAPAFPGLIEPEDSPPDHSLPTREVVVRGRRVGGEGLEAGRRRSWREILGSEEVRI
jgi:hypothetical protein